jgi:methionyl-tRNA formyltransferase
MQKNKRIVFMGTPDFASHILNELLLKEFPIVGVVTVPDKPAGRGMKLQESAVKKVAKKYDLPILQPEKLKNPEFLSELQQLNADIFVVIAFRMLPKEVWQMPKDGTFNLHGSLLPQYRGAAPIHWAVINGEKKTGVTTFFIDEKIDTGAIIDYAECDITEEDTVGSVYTRLMHIGADLVEKTLVNIESGNIQLQEQHSIIEKENLEIKDAPKIFKKDCLVDFNRPVNTVYNHIRGLNPFPGSHAFVKAENFDKKQIKFFACSYKKEEASIAAGTFFYDKPSKEIRIQCLDGYIILDELQLEGKRRMKAQDFASGFNWKNRYSFN